MIIESTRRMTKPEQEAYDLGFHEGKYSSIPKWISVEERLPKCGERVLITDGAAVFEVYLSISHKWVRSGLLWQENVTHWMPLPSTEGIE